MVKAQLKRNKFMNITLFIITEISLLKLFCFMDQKNEATIEEKGNSGALL